MEALVEFGCGSGGGLLLEWRKAAAIKKRGAAVDGRWRR